MFDCCHCIARSVSIHYAFVRQWGYIRPPTTYSNPFPGNGRIHIVFWFWARKNNVRRLGRPFSHSAASRFLRTAALFRSRLHSFVTRFCRANLRLQDVYFLFWFLACPVEVVTSWKATAPIKRFVLDLGTKSLQMSVGEIEDIGDGIY